MGFGAGDIVGLIWSHPIASVVVALLFTPPLFPIVVFFSPLLISTALVVLAMISMGSDADESGATPGGGYGHSHYKRDWQEQEDTDRVTFMDDEDGPLLNDEDKRLHKRRKGAAAPAAHDDGWFEKVKVWEETGRAWVDSVLHQEARRPSSEPLFSSSAAAAETREVRFAQPTPQVKQPPLTPATVGSSVPVPVHSTENDPPPLEKDPGSVVEEDQARARQISVEQEDDMGKNSRAFPVLDDEKSKSSEQGGGNSSSKVKGDEKLPASGVPEVIGAKSSEQNKETTARGETFSVAPREEVGSAAENKGDSSSSGRSSDQNTAHQQESASRSATGSGDGKSAPSSSAATGERGRRGEHHRTPSVAVALSEKLNVPLEDIMSLLAGDEKPLSSSNGAPPAPHEEGDWTSSSDDEVARAAAKGGDQTSSEKSKLKG